MQRRGPDKGLSQTCDEVRVATRRRAWEGGCTGLRLCTSTVWYAGALPVSSCARPIRILGRCLHRVVLTSHAGPAHRDRRWHPDRATAGAEQKAEQVHATLLGVSSPRGVL